VDEKRWGHGRSAGSGQALRGSGADRSIFRPTGTALSTSLQSAQVAWLKSSRDPRLRSLEVVLHCKDWLYYRLTSIRATDRCEAVNSLGDFRTRTYSAEVLQLLDVEDLRHLLPEIIDGARQHHPLTPEPPPQPRDSAQERRSCLRPRIMSRRAWRWDSSTRAMESDAPLSEARAFTWRCWTIRSPFSAGTHAAIVYMHPSPVHT
jgi:hypothetical protein